MEEAVEEGTWKPGVKMMKNCRNGL